MLLIDKESGLSGMVLRPLSAGVLEPTLPEKEGWVKRDKLLAICGRQRKEQFALAAGLGIKDFPCPSGGCLLTDPEFSRRLKDLLQHAQLTLGNIQFLKAGRYFRLGDKAVLAVGRDEKGNQRLLGLAQAGDYIFMPAGEIPGPVALGRGVFDPAQLELACRVTCRYCDLNGSPQARISSFRGEEISPEFIADYLKGQTPCCGIKLRVAPLGEAELGAFRV
jgi:hypothetical protein